MGHKHTEAEDILVNFLTKDTNEWMVEREVSFWKNRFDVVAINMYPSKADIRAYEVKVTQSDLDQELRNGKWCAMVEAGASPYLAIGPDVKLDRKDVPAGVGLVKISKRSCRHEIRVKRSDPLAPIAQILLWKFLQRVNNRLFDFDRKNRLRTLNDICYGEDIEGEMDRFSLQVKIAAKKAGRSLSYELSQINRIKSDLY